MRPVAWCGRQSSAARLTAPPRLLVLGLLLALLLAAGAPGQIQGATAAVPAPRDPAAGRPAARVLVASGGIQRIGAADLALVGLDPADAARLQLWHSGVPVPLEQRGAGASLELRFFAPTPGDRWNQHDTYWLTLEAQPGLRMATRELGPASVAGGAPVTSEGRWRDQQHYDSLTPGPAGDHWFAASLKSDADGALAVLTGTLDLVLPLAGPLELTVWGTALTPGVHGLEVIAYDGNNASAQGQISWAGRGDFTQTVSIEVPGDREHIDFALRLAARTMPDEVLIGGIDWAHLARLAPKAGAGASFRGSAAMQAYQFSSVPARATLYDVSDPARPQLLRWDGKGFVDAGARRYMLVGADELQQPQVLAYERLRLPQSGEAIYIAPVAFHVALEPLLEQRRATGHSVALVDVQTIYDAWSFGQVDPEAIRSFLRYAMTHWQPQPLAATLVGKGTRDPWGYSDHLQPNWVPPYLAQVDPWVGETACETCYGQLDGANALDDDQQDLAIGRLPVKSADELATVVAKVLAYETTPGGLDWRSRALLVGDNGQQADGAPDPAGDFARFLDLAAAQLPAGIVARRVYYDPWQRDAFNQPLAQPWREANAKVVRDRVRAGLDAGAGLVVYAGHASQWQWAETGPPLPESERYLLNLYDADELTNSVRLPVVLAMTCMTSAFHIPSFSGTSLDERLLLSAQGGAVAVWGPTGLGVAYGHEALLRGFLAKLREAPPGQATLGDLTMAGLAELRGDGSRSGGIYASTLRTYALLGDPLTPMRLEGVERVWLPMVER